MQDINLIDPKDYHYAIDKLTVFFKDRKFFMETPTQHRLTHPLSILAACEDPWTLATFTYGGMSWPLPQTGQMWLEYELLTKPDNQGYYCVSTSWRKEPKPKPGRHDLIFPMFEFETHGDINTLKKLEISLLNFLGFKKLEELDENIFPSPANPIGTYKHIAEKYKTDEIKDIHEEMLWKEYGPVFFLTQFPEHTSPFWNMKRNGNYANKIDVILYGIETIGSAERGVNPEEMRGLFHSISNGGYVDRLYSEFGKDRVEQSLEQFLSLKFFPRCGGGIGITRLIRALKMAKIL